MSKMRFMKNNSPPEEGWQAQPDGVVMIAGVIFDHPALRAPLQRRGIYPALIGMTGGEI
jgi:hypothetical protein